MPTFREIRIAQGRTQLSLARETGFDVATVCRIECGHMCNKSTAEALCRALRCKLDDLSGINISTKKRGAPLGGYPKKESREQSCN